MDESAVAAWIERYVRAWETNDPAAIGELFAEHARYYQGPDGEPWPATSRSCAAGRTTMTPRTSAICG